MQGKGSFVAGGNAEMLREERLREIEERLLQAIAAGRALDLGDEELIEMMRTLSFVAGGNAEMLREERLREIEERLLQAIAAGRALDLGDEELIEMMRTLLESDD